MPSYVIEFDSSHGPERRLFTLDDDRTLEIQLFQVLEELRQSGRVLQGAPGDELAASWNGNELTMHAPLSTLGVDGSRPLVLRMRPRPTVVAPAARVPASRYTMRHVVLPPVEGALGALAAWGLAGFLTDLRSPIVSVDRADLAVAVLLGGAIGLALCIGSMIRGVVRAPVAVACTVVCALSGLLLLAALAFAGDAPTVRQFLLARIVGWLLLAVAMALTITAPLGDLGSARWAEATVVALCAGLLSALVASLPGVSELWQAVAFLVCGALVGGAALSIPIWRHVGSATGASALPHSSTPVRAA